MRCRWIAGAAAAVLGIGGAVGSFAPVFGASAAAAAPSYKLGASGTGLQLTLGGHTLAGATSTVSAHSGAPVVATAAGELTPTHVASQRATASSPGASQKEAQVCTAHPSATFPAPFSSAVNLESACSSASASEGPAGQPSASATGSVGSLALSPPAGGSTPATSLTALLPTPVTPGSALASSLTGILGQLPQLPQSGLPLGTVVQKVAAAASGSSVTTLVSGSLGPSTSSITTSAGALSATSVDTGATISLLTGAGASGGPLLTVSIGRAVTAARIDQATGAVSESGTAASVTVTVAPPAGTRQTISITPGVSKSFFTGTPLQTSVSVSTPTTTAKNGRATASGVIVDLAQGATGGVVLDLGASTAQATATAPVTVAAGTTAAPTTPAVTGATTVHTGEPWAGPLPIALLAMSLLTGVGLLARRHFLGIGHLVGRTAARLVRPKGR
jgi:hypothetical protein